MKLIGFINFPFKRINKNNRTRIRQNKVTAALANAYSVPHMDKKYVYTFAESFGVIWNQTPGYKLDLPIKTKIKYKINSIPGHAQQRPARMLLWFVLVYPLMQLSLSLSAHSRWFTLLALPMLLALLLVMWVITKK